MKKCTLFLLALTSDQELGPTLTNRASGIAHQAFRVFQQRGEQHKLMSVKGSFHANEIDRRHKVNHTISFHELRAAIRAWRRYGFYSLNPREAEIIDSVYSRLTLRPLRRS